MNRRQLGFGLLTIFIVSLFYGNTVVPTVNQTKTIGDTEVTPTPAGDWIQGLGINVPTMDDQAAYSKNIADWLVLNAKPASSGVTWSSGLENRSGYDGVAGVISFLAQMYQTTKNASYLETARKAALWLQSGSIKVGTGKYKESDYQPRNYTGMESGSGGIGEAFLDLYKVTGNQSYLLSAQDSAIWLQSQANIVGEGMRWPYKDPVVVSNVLNPPLMNKTNNGTTPNPLSYLNTWDAFNYDINSVNNVVDCEFYFNVSQWGLYNILTTIEQNQFLNFNLQVSIGSNVALSPNYSNISISDTPSTWMPIYPSNITTTMESVAYTTTISQDISKFVRSGDYGNQFRFRVRAAYSSAFTVSINAMNLTISYDDTVYYPDWSLGAAGIGQFFLDLYKVTSNLTYYYTAANASRYLRDTAKAGATGLYWDKQGTGFTSIKDGVAGIGKFLVDLYTVNSSDRVPLDLAVQGANWTIQQRSATSEGFTEYNVSLGTTRRFEYSNVSVQDYRSGFFDGMAGIGDFLLDLAGVTAGPNGTLYLTAANQTAAFLTAYNITSFGTTFTLLNVTSPYTYRWEEIAGGNSFANGSQTGSSGNLLFLSRYATLTGSKAIGSVVDGALRYLTAMPIQSNFSGLGFYYYKGCAGLGDSLLQARTVAGTGMKAGIGSLTYLLTQENNGRWNDSTTDANKYSGMYYGSAGIGLALLEGYKATGNTLYLEAARRAALSLSVASGQYQYIGSTTTYLGNEQGLSGIAEFLLEMFVSTSNTTYRDWATSTLDRLLAVNKGNLDSARWNASLGFGSNDIGYNLRYGTAGIASCFLKAFQATANSTYMRVAKGALVFLDSVDISPGYMNHWNPTSGDASDYTGWDLGSAGIGAVYLQAFQLTSNQSYLASASGVADWLTTQHDGVSGSWFVKSNAPTIPAAVNFAGGTAGVVNFLIQLYAINASTTINSEIVYGLNYLVNPGTGILSLTDLGWSTGLAGTLSVLSQAVLYYRTLVSTMLSLGVKKLTTPSFRETSGAWHVDTTATTVAYSGIAFGSAGIFRITAALPDISRPSLSASGDILDVNYYETVPITITASDGYSDIASVFLRVTYNLNPPILIPASWVIGNDYLAVIPTQSWATYVSFVAVVQDESGQISIDDNSGANYQYVVQDHDAPNYSNIKVIVGGADRPAPAYGENAKFTIIASEPSGASQVQSAVLYYSFEGGAYQQMALDEYPPYSYTFQTPDPGVVGASWCYGDAFSFYFNITDYAGNRLITPVNNTYIHDFTSPVINPYYRMALNSPEYPALSPFDITINVSNPTTCEAPLPKEGGAFILYTTNGIDWVRVNFTLSENTTTYSLFKGNMPGQNMGDLVRFVLGAQDAAGNLVYMGIDKNTYARFEDIPSEAYFYFNVSMNWLLFFVIVAVVAAIVVFSYVIYMRRGGYWQRMRRTASAKATAISVQAKFASLYYWMLEKMQNFGVKLRKAGRAFSEKMGDFGAWMGEKLGDRISRFFRAIGRVIGDFFKGIGNAIAGIFGVIKDIIIKIRWYQVLLVVLFGLLLIIFPVIKWIMDQAYPLRAVFFMGMGLVIFVGAFVIFIMNLIYQISYK